MGLLFIDPLRPRREPRNCLQGLHSSTRAGTAAHYCFLFLSSAPVQQTARRLGWNIGHLEGPEAMPRPDSPSTPQDAPQTLHLLFAGREGTQSFNLKSAQRPHLYAHRHLLRLCEFVLGRIRIVVYAREHPPFARVVE